MGRNRSLSQPEDWGESESAACQNSTSGRKFVRNESVKATFPPRPFYGGGLRTVHTTVKTRRSQNDGKSYRDTCNNIPSGIAHLRPSGETLSHKCLDRSLFFRGFGRPESDLAREGLLLGIASSQRWRDTKEYRRSPKGMPKLQRR